MIDMHYATKLLTISLTLLLSHCAITAQEKQAQFEVKLNAKVGKMTQDIIKEHGKPIKYSNTSPLNNNTKGAFMIYDYTNQGKDCVLVYKYSKKTLKILDWQYTGNCVDNE